jgi:hypothetical protein
MRRGLAVLAVVSLLGVGVAGAAVHQGEIDIDFSGTWLTENAGTGGLDFDGLFLSGGIGYFLTDHIEVEGAVLGIWASGNPTVPFVSDWDENFYAFGAKAKYHFMPKNRWVPYVGGQFFWGKDNRDTVGTLYDADFDGYLWGPLAGLRFELTEHADFFVEYQYHIWGGEISDASVVNSPNWEDGHLVTLGLIYAFR